MRLSPASGKGPAESHKGSSCPALPVPKSPTHGAILRSNWFYFKIIPIFAVYGTKTVPDGNDCLHCHFSGRGVPYPDDF